jgi:uncharacterized delta-60 repeat protein
MHKEAKMSMHLKRILYKAVLISLVLALLSFTFALAASGHLDPTFDGDGLVTTNLSGEALDVVHALAIQSDGRILAAGYRTGATNDFAVMRYDTNGSVELLPNYVKDFFGGNDIAQDIALQSNGKFVLSGSSCNGFVTIGDCDLALARYNTDGRLDTTFSGDGLLTTDFGGGNNGSLGGLAIQSDGKIVVAGYMHNGTDRDFAVYRYLSSGKLDTTFSGDGRFRFGFVAGKDDTATDLALQSNGKILIAGYAHTGGPVTRNFAIARLNPNGTLDATFNVDGKQMTNFGGNDTANGLALQSDGKIVVVGEKHNLTTLLSSFAIARYNPNGTLDNTFGDLLPTGKRNGRRVFSILAGVSSSAWDVIVQRNGKIVVVGSTQNGSGFSDFGLARLKPDGGLDTSFSGEDGKLRIHFGGSHDFGFALVRQPSDGNYVLGGAAFGVTDANFDFALARVLN